MALRRDGHHADEYRTETRTTWPNVWRWAAIAAIAIGVALRAWQYFANASIVLDEAAIARNVLDRHVLGLLTPLDYAQVAPPGFLLSVKLCTVLFGPSEWVLRLTPFTCGLAALLLFRVVARLFLRPPAAVAATFMFATAVPLVFYSSQAKQYSGDVVVSLAVLWAALRLLDRPRIPGKSLAAFWALGLLTLLFSDPAVFMLTVAGAVLVVEAFLRGRPDKWTRFALASGWAIEVLAAVGYGYRSMTVVDRAYMHAFWTALFVPHRLTAVGPWVLTVARSTFSVGGAGLGFEGLHYPFAVFGLLFLAGTIALLWTHPVRGALIAGPIVLVLGAAAAGLYPFMTRVGLFMVPLYFLAVAYGTDTASRALLGRRAGAFGCLVLMPLAVLAVSRRLPPDLPEHARPVIQYIEDHRQPSDALWVYYGAGQAFEYYQHIFPIGGDVQFGDCDRQNPRAYLRQVDVERGRARVWFLFAHFAASFHFGERAFLLAYLDAIGRRLDEFHAPAEDTTPQVAAAYLYDLSSARTLAHVDADTFPISGKFGKFTPTRWSCYGVASPIPSRNAGAASAVLHLAER